jgi:flagellar hook assembly protein FlgD
MIKILAITAVLLLSAQSYSQTMVIHNSDGSTVRIAVADINKITFNLGATQNVPRTEALKKVKSIFAKIYPNPFMTRIEYSVSEPSNVRIAVLNMQGQVVRILRNHRTEKGQYSAAWDACDGVGRKVTSGAYIIDINISGKSFSKNLFIVH